MRTHGHREKIITHWGLGRQGLVEEYRGWGDWGRIALGEIPNVDDGVMDGMFILKVFLLFV